MAAQLYAAARADNPNFDGKIRRGEFEHVRSWLADNVHRHGQRYTTPDLIERATGGPLDPSYYVDWVTRKYEDIYDI